LGRLLAEPQSWLLSKTAPTPNVTIAAAPMVAAPKDRRPRFDEDEVTASTVESVTREVMGVPDRLEPYGRLLFVLHHWPRLRGIAGRADGSGRGSTFGGQGSVGPGTANPHQLRRAILNRPGFGGGSSVR
jgi:hypothetical protein